MQATGSTRQVPQTPARLETITRVLVWSVDLVGHPSVMCWLLQPLHKRFTINDSNLTTNLLVIWLQAMVCPSRDVDSCAQGHCWVGRVAPSR